MTAGICVVPVSPLRRDPSHRSEMVTQQLFGETCTVLEIAKDHWIKVKCSYDGYEGWCQEMHVLVTDAAKVEAKPSLFASELINAARLNGEPIYLPLGATVDLAVNGENLLPVKYEGQTWDASTAKKDIATIRNLAFKFLNTGYLWGGKSNFGIDCSGYTQSVYKMLNVPLLRDASQQATQGTEVASLSATRCGDLAFFDNEEGKITHVGMLLNQEEIIHSSGKVRVDKIDAAGIINRETSERTHKLRSVRRYFDVVDG
jgi:gamma-D-glutamyl-L-lysine dipeptidyl-peptidase